MSPLHKGFFNTILFEIYLTRYSYYNDEIVVLLLKCIQQWQPIDHGPKWCNKKWLTINITYLLKSFFHAITTFIHEITTKGVFDAALHKRSFVKDRMFKDHQTPCHRLTWEIIFFVFHWNKSRTTSLTCFVQEKEKCYKALLSTIRSYVAAVKVRLEVATFLVA